MSLASVVAILILYISLAAITWWAISAGIGNSVITAIFAGFALSSAAVSAVLLDAGLDQLAVRFIITAAVFAFISVSGTVVRRRRGARAGEEK